YMCETHAGAFSNSFSREERLEYPLLCSRIHPAACVLDRQTNKFSRLCFRIDVNDSFIELDNTCDDTEFTAVRHRIARINNQVHDNLFEVDRVSFNSRQPRGAIQ